MTATPSQRNLKVMRLVAEAVDKLIHRALPMNPVTQAEIDHCREWAARQAATSTSAADAELMASSVALLTAMAAALPEYAAATAALVPALTMRAETLREQGNPRIAAAIELFPQHTR